MDIYAVGIALFSWKLYRRYLCPKIGDVMDALDGYVDHNGWEKWAHSLYKDLWFLIIMMLVYGAYLAWRLVVGFRPWMAIVILVVLAYRWGKTYKGYNVVCRHVKAASKEEYLQKTRNFLVECKVTEIDMDAENPMVVWQTARERGKSMGFCPVLLDVDPYLFDSFDDQSHYTDRARFRLWRSKVLQPDFLPDAQKIFSERLEELKEEYDEEEWQEDVIGEIDGYDDPELDFTSDTVWLVEIPVEHPWQVLAYIPTRLGTEDECLRTVEHMAIAKYWYEKYGAEILHLSGEQIDFWIPQPVTGDTCQLAEEHYVYAGNSMCSDYNSVLHDYTNLSTLASALKKITFWNFW